MSVVTVVTYSQEPRRHTGHSTLLNSTRQKKGWGSRERQSWAMGPLLNRTSPLAPIIKVSPIWFPTECLSSQALRIRKLFQKAQKQQLPHKAEIARQEKIPEMICPTLITILDEPPWTNTDIQQSVTSNATVSYLLCESPEQASKQFNWYTAIALPRSYSRKGVRVLEG